MRIDYSGQQRCSEILRIASLRNEFPLPMTHPPSGYNPVFTYANLGRGVPGRLRTLPPCRRVKHGQCNFEFEVVIGTLKQLGN